MFMRHASQARKGKETGMSLPATIFHWLKETVAILWKSWLFSASFGRVKICFVVSETEHTLPNQKLVQITVSAACPCKKKTEANRCKMQMSVQQF